MGEATPEDAQTDESPSRTEHETVREALNRYEFQEEHDNSRLAHGEVEGVDVLLAAELARERPQLAVYVGGELEVYNEEDIEPEYVGGVSVTKSYDRMDMLETGFAALAEKYDLEEINA